MYIYICIILVYNQALFLYIVSPPLNVFECQETLAFVQNGYLNLITPVKHVPGGFQEVKQKVLSGVQYVKQMILVVLMEDGWM